MPGAPGGKAARRKMLDDLAGELDGRAGPGCRRRCTLRLIPYLSVRRAGRGRLRVYCVGTGGLYAFLTGDGQLIVPGGGGPAAAAREVAAAAGRAPAVRAARSGRAAGQPGS